MIDVASHPVGASASRSGSTHTEAARSIRDAAPYDVDGQVLLVSGDRTCY